MSLSFLTFFFFSSALANLLLWAVPFLGNAGGLSYTMLISDLASPWVVLVASPSRW